MVQQLSLAQRLAQRPKAFACHEKGIRGDGPLDAQVMIIGHAPGSHEMTQRRPFVGPSGRLLKNTIRDVGYDVERCYFTNLLCFQTDNPSPEEEENCWKRLEQEITFVAPKLLVLLGREVFEKFIYFHDFSEARGMIQWEPKYDCWIMPTYHSAGILRADNPYTLAADFVTDFCKIPMFFSDAPHPTETAKVQFAVAKNAQEAQAILNTLPKDRPIILDVETDNSDEDVLDAHKDKLSCLCLSGGGFTWVIHAEHLPGLVWPQDVQYSAHSAMFDMQVMLAHGVDLPIVHDSLLAHFAVNPSARHNLKTLARQFCYAGFYEAEVAKARKGKNGGMAAVPEAVRDEYCAKDGAYAARLLRRFLPTLEAEGQLPLYRDILIPAANTFKYMQFYELPINRDRLAELALEWIPTLSKKYKALTDFVLQYNGTKDFNPNSGDQLAKFLFSPHNEGGLALRSTQRTAKSKRPSTTAEALEDIENDHPFVAQLQDYRHLFKLMSTYVDQMPGLINPTNNRLHPRPLIHGTVGCRCSYGDPAINTLPRPENPKDAEYAPKLRRLFTAETEDYVIIEADFKQAELWVAYFYSQDAVLGRDLAGDIHTQNAIEIFNTSTPTPGQRSDAKRTTFGMLYLIGPDKLARQTKKSYHEAAYWIRNQTSKYWRYREWIDEAYHETRRLGYTETVTKRRRPFPIIFEGDTKPLGAIANFPIQSTAHDYLLAGLIESYGPLRRIGCYAMLDIHDALLFHAKKSCLDEAIPMIKHYLTKPRFGFPGLPVEIKVGLSWAESKKIL